jgi:DNA-directed RNA polymerase subunit RPC12/RpoP
MAQVICVECNATVSDESDFCSECGFPFASLQPVTCPECGNKVVFSADACPVCNLPYEKLIERLTPESVAIATESDALAEPSVIEPEPSPEPELVMAEEAVAIAETEEAPEMVVLPAADPIADSGVEPGSEVTADPEHREEVVTVDAVEVTPEEMAALSAVIAGGSEATVTEVVIAAEEVEEDTAGDDATEPITSGEALPLVEEAEPVESSLLVDVAALSVAAPVGGDLAAQLEELHAEVLRLGSMVTNSEQLVAGLVDRVSAQHEEAVSRDLLSAVASELGGATARLEAGQKTLASDIAAQIGKLKAEGNPESAGAPAKPGDMVDYLLYVALAILLFTVLNTFIAAYLVRVVKLSE